MHEGKYNFKNAIVKKFWSKLYDDHESYHYKELATSAFLLPGILMKDNSI